MRRRPEILLLALVLGACGGEELAARPAPVGTVGGVGVLPEVLSRSPALGVTTTSSTVPRPTVTVDRTELPPIGERVEGNRLIMIGDSILASTSRRYTGEMCLGLVPLHWAVEVDAEKSRFIDFGTRVLNARLDPEAGVDWDVAAVFLGTNYGGDIDVYTRELDRILTRLAPRPTLLYTVTEFRPNRADVNAAIRSMLTYYPNVQLIDWAKLTADDPGLLGSDGYHLSPAGISRLVLETAAALGAAPTGGGGDCLSSRFTDDSAGTVPGGRSGGTPTTAGGTRPRATTTTTTGGPTTVPPSGSTTTGPATSSVTTVPPATTAAATTTAPPVTSPPTTQVTTPPPPTTLPVITLPEQDPPTLP
ncbi:MAG TPA: hypothetical protein VFV63_02520 [Ilumatobacteraceae bacterium]|nr:hypothetical protein [Ilumatobacteraceae bacterium]